ncbi:methyltransferase domain-containing protein [Brevundimonas sp. 2R-24]|uniref:Methyltransferase domain-containing protein n=1 Tax=Peiella sedimenti TaxID=3061083 RepID=A0ABT8SM09_9CAUL|nr:methyltransferase domain-containing protein [Caulobacteraceae bacterium XZ-24]
MSTVVPLVPAHKYETDAACAMCGSASRRVMPMPANEDAARLRETWGCTFVECEDCGLRFYSPRLEEEYAVCTQLEDGAEEEAISLIEKGLLFGEPAGGPESQIKRLKAVYTEIFDQLCERYLAANGRPPRSMFEVGASVGWFSRAATDRAVAQWGRFDTAGCDVNIFSARLARERNGLNVQGQTLRSYQVAADQYGRYDLIAAYGALEQSYSPRTDLLKLHSMAAPGGLLATKTFVDDFDPDGAMIHPLYHPHHFTLSTLREMVERTGWRIMEFDDQSDRGFAQVSIVAQKI